MILFAQLDGALIALFLLEIRAQIADSQLRGDLLPYRIKQLRVFERTDRQGRREVVITAIPA